jgi:hypothetical protein
MTTNFDQGGSQFRNDGAKRPGSRPRQYMIAPVQTGFTEQKLLELINRVIGIETVRTHAASGVISPPIAVVLATDDKIATLRRTTGDMLVIEADGTLRAATFPGLWPPVRATTVTPLGPVVTIQVQVLGDGGQALENAEVQIVGEHWATQGLTDNNGQAALSLYGELPETITQLLVKPRSNCWGFSQHRPQLRADAVNTIVLQPLIPQDERGWGGKAMRFDRLPQECRGAGTKIALIDSGIATSQPQLAGVTHGIALRGGDAAAWTQDVVGHGTLCAGVISAVPRGTNNIRGGAVDAELHVCKLPPDARCSDIVEAIEYCLQNSIDIVCLGYGGQRSSAIVEQRIMMAKQQGIAIVAAAGNSAGPVQFPACSPHVLAIGAIGQIGCYPSDSPHALHAASARSLPGGLFVPAFSCGGPELDLCAPGVAVISCQAPDGYAAADGTSLAASYVAALAAVVLAHHADFRRDFAKRDFRRVERLFQILKDTAQPIGHPWQTGAGLPDATRSLGLISPPWRAELPFDGGLAEMRQAIRQMDPVNTAQFSDGFVPIFEPPRGPAMVTNLPLNPFPAIMAGDGESEMDAATARALKVAMTLAGLTSGF